MVSYLIFAHPVPHVTIELHCTAYRCEHLLGYTQTPTVFGSIHSKNFPLQVFNPKEILKKFCEKSPNFFSLFFALCVFSLLLSGVATKAVMAASAASEATAAQAEAEAAVAAFTLLSSSFSRL